MVSQAIHQFFSMGYQKINLCKVTGRVRRFGEFPKLVDSIMEELCNIAKEELVNAYLDGWSGDSARSVDWKKVDDNTWEVFAESEGILYLEFGAGILKNRDGASESREVLNFLDIDGEDYEGSIVPIGTYGMGLGKLNAWYSKSYGNVTTGAKSRHGFANAINEVIARADEVIDRQINEFFGFY